MRAATSQRGLYLFAAAAVLVGMTATAFAQQDAGAGRAKAQPCAVCHGPVGISTQPDAPNLAGQPALYLAAQLRAYRSGARKHEVMSLIAKPLTDDDIQQLAVWFSSIQVKATPPS
jgi:cytochrome c553